MLFYYADTVSLVHPKIQVLNDMTYFKLNPIICRLFAFGLCVVSSEVNAAAFQLWEQDGASVGNYHAGYAAIANDASTAFYNPAGITRIKNQQMVFAGSAVTPSFIYRGTVQVNTFSDDPQSVTAQGGEFAFVPAFHYVAPISDTIGFGFSVDAPFGSKVNYGQNTILRYVSTVTDISVVDVSPTLGIKITDKASLGFGPDVQKMEGEFDQVGTYAGKEQDSDGIAKATGSGYGYHAGILYEFTPDTRIGASYHSQVVHHLTGYSSFTGPLADAVGGPIQSDRAIVNITLPPYTALSFYHRAHPQFAVMSSLIYTQWSTIQRLQLQNIAGLLDVEPNRNIIVDVPQYLQNAWNFSIGGDYYPREDITLRAGLGFDQTPVQNAYRTVQMPDNNRYIIAFGGHYQASKTIGLDVSWMHVFINKSHIIPPVQVTGDEQSVTNGSVTGGADVLSGQITWDIL